MTVIPNRGRLQQHSAPLLSKVGSSLSAKQINFFLGVFKGPDAAITGDADLNVALKQLAKRKLIGKPNLTRRRHHRHNRFIGR